MRFYVYELIDPRDDAVFYVGKGQKRRIECHEAEAAKGKHSRKCDRIREIWGAGHSITKHIVSRHSDENEALEAEASRIADIGLANLTNVFPGGVLGADAYLRAVREREQRAALDEHVALKRNLEMMIPIFAMLSRAKANGGSIGAYAGSRWIDASEAFESWLTALIEKLGWGEVEEAFASCNVELRRA